MQGAFIVFPCFLLMLGYILLFQQSSRSSFAAAFIPQHLGRHYCNKNFPNNRLLFIATKALPVTTMSTATTNSLNEYKRAKLDDAVVSTKVIGTHSGTFQADEAMGCWMLQQLAEYRNSKIVRSRDPQVLETCDIVLDVGGVYDHAKLKYDHHQRDYDERFDPKIGRCDGDNDKDGSITTTTTLRCTKLSASGLIYRHYGKDVIQTCYPNLSAANVDLVYTQLYDTLLEALDAIDTGVEIATSTLYSDTTGLASRVSRLNPRWNEMIDGPLGQQPPNPDERFQLAVQLCGNDFQSVLVKIVESDLPARELVEQAIQERHQVDATGEIICLPSGGLPWKGYLYELEREYQVNPIIKFVLYVDEGGMWRVQAVTVQGKAFVNRLSLPEEWRGVRDEDLAQVTNIPGSRFVHAAGFIGGNDTYEGALAMAQEALKQRQE
jgi:uncharacterized UPF0160 family protein